MSSTSSSSSLPSTGETYIDALGIDLETYAAMTETERSECLAQALAENPELDLETVEDQIDAISVSINAKLRALDDIIDEADEDTVRDAQLLESDLKMLDEVCDGLFDDVNVQMDVLEKQNVDMTDGASKSLDTSDATENSTYTVNAVSDGATTSSTGIFDEEAYASSADTDGDGEADVDVNHDGVINSLDMDTSYNADQMLTIELEETDVLDLVSYDEATGEVKYAVTRTVTADTDLNGDGTINDDEKDVESTFTFYIIVQGNPGNEYHPFWPKLALSGGTGGLTQEKLEESPWNQVTTFMYETPTSEYPLSYYVDGTLPGGDYAKYENVSLNTTVTPSVADYEIGMRYEYSFKDDASCTFTVNVSSTAQVTQTNNGDTTTITVKDNGKTVTYVLHNVGENVNIDIVGTDNVTSRSTLLPDGVRNGPLVSGEIGVRRVDVGAINADMISQSAIFGLGRTGAASRTDDDDDDTTRSRTRSKSGV